MNILNKQLIKIIKSLEGEIIAIGVSDKEVLKAIEDNNKIINCNLLNVLDKKKEYKKEIVYVKNFKKYFKKKKNDYIICNIDTVYKQLKEFVPKSIFITNKIIYLFSDSKDIDIELIKKRYQRYTKVIECEEYGDKYLITINIIGSKNLFFSDIVYFINDSLYSLAEYVSNFLIS